MDVKRTMSRKAAVTVIREVGVPNVKLDVKRSGDSLIRKWTFDLRAATATWSS